MSSNSVHGHGHAIVIVDCNDVLAPLGGIAMQSRKLLRLYRERLLWKRSLKIRADISKALSDYCLCRNNDTVAHLLKTHTE